MHFKHVKKKKGVIKCEYLTDLILSKVYKCMHEENKVTKMKVNIIQNIPLIANKNVCNQIYYKDIFKLKKYNDKLFIEFLSIIQIMCFNIPVHFSDIPRLFS